MVLVLLTALLGFADWFPAPGWSRPMMLGQIATIGIYGYFREKADQKKALVASPMWRDIDSLRRQNALSRQQNEELRKENETISQEIEQIERDRTAEERNRDIEKAEQIARLARIRRV